MLPIAGVYHSVLPDSLLVMAGKKIQDLQLNFSLRLKKAKKIRVFKYHIDILALKSFISLNLSLKLILIC